MMGKAQSLEPKLFYGRLNVSDRIPRDYPLRRIKEMVDFGFVRKEVAALYGYNGNESLDPALVLKLQFLLFYENVRSERELMRVLAMRLDWLWFCGMDIDAEIPDHSVLSKARRRWGLETYEKVFVQVLQTCLEAGLVEAGTEHVDSSLLKANASVDSRIPRRLWEQLEQADRQEQTQEQGIPPDESDPGPPARGALAAVGPHAAAAGRYAGMSVAAAATGAVQHAYGQPHRSGQRHDEASRPRDGPGVSGPQFD